MGVWSRCVNIVSWEFSSRMLCVYMGPLWRRIWCRWLVGFVSAINTCAGGQAVRLGEEIFWSSRLGVILCGVCWVGVYAFGGAMV